jgi:hypothetical protein
VLGPCRQGRVRAGSPWWDGSASDAPQ